MPIYPGFVTSASKHDPVPGAASTRLLGILARARLSRVLGLCGPVSGALVNLRRLIRAASLPRKTQRFTNRQTGAVLAWYAAMGYQVEWMQALGGGDGRWRVTPPDGMQREHDSLESAWNREQRIQCHNWYYRALSSALKRTYVRADLERRCALARWCREGMHPECCPVRDGRWAGRRLDYPFPEDLSRWWPLRMGSVSLHREATREVLSEGLLDWLVQEDALGMRRRLERRLPRAIVTPLRQRI